MDGLVEELVEQGECKGRGLAGTGLGEAQHVTAGAAGGNGFELDRPGFIEASGADAPPEGFVEPELVEPSRCNGG